MHDIMINIHPNIKTISYIGESIKPKILKVHTNISFKNKKQQTGIFSSQKYFHFFLFRSRSGCLFFLDRFF